jgi:hypothetical protein
MMDYYNMVERALLDCPEPAGNWSFPSATKVFTPQYEATIEECMQRAVGLAKQDGDPHVASRVANQRKFWQQARGIVRDMRRKQTPKK